MASATVVRTHMRVLATAANGNSHGPPPPPCSLVVGANYGAIQVEQGPLRKAHEAHYELCVYEGQSNSPHGRHLSLGDALLCSAAHLGVPRQQVVQAAARQAVRRHRGHRTIAA